MIKGFALICINCHKNNKYPFDTIVHNKYGIILFKCFTCGYKADFEPDMRNMPTKEQKKLLDEKIKIQEELDKKDLKN